MYSRGQRCLENRAFWRNTCYGCVFSFNRIEDGEGGRNYEQYPGIVSLAVRLVSLDRRQLIGVDRS